MKCTQFGIYLYLCSIMRKAYLTILLLMLALLPTFADDSENKESSRRINHICDLYNNDQNDSLILQAPIDMEFHKSQGCWEHYYETWMHLVNTYVFMGKVNTGLKEVKLMHNDAIQHNNNYGIALAFYAMGNAYINMGYIEEAIKCYQQSLDHIKLSNSNASTLNDIFSYYLDALNEQKRYDEMGAVTAQWKVALDTMANEEKTKSGKLHNSGIWYSYYYLACVQQDLGLGKLNDAEEDIDKVEKHNTQASEFITLSILYYRAQLWLQRKDFEKALDYNTQRLEKSLNLSDMSSLLLIYKQRALIMKGLGNYQEAAEMYKNLYELSDSIYKKDARTQINELNTMFQVSEMELVKRLERNHSITIIAITIAVALALLLSYWYWSNRRLKKKNEELAIARAQAEESLRMKTDFIQNISHEIRTPLNILSGFSQILAQDGAELPIEIRKEACTNIEENTNRITSLINRLLALADSNSRTLIERTDCINATQLCYSAIINCGIADNQHYHFSFDSLIPDTLTINTSEKYVTQAIGQLLDNAMKFTPEGGSIRMQCQEEDNVLTISIEDTGCGVPKEKADEIFSEFVQLDEFKDGVGIGLPLSRNIVRQLGGDIKLDTNYQQGARFVLTLPL